jgi:hypothetical protein
LGAPTNFLSSFTFISRRGTPTRRRHLREGPRRQFAHSKFEGQYRLPVYGQPSMRSFGNALASWNRAARIFPLAFRAPVTRTVKVAVPTACAASGAENRGAMLKNNPIDTVTRPGKRRTWTLLCITVFSLGLETTRSSSAYLGRNCRASSSLHTGTGGGLSASNQYEKCAHGLRHLRGKLTKQIACRE